MKDWILYNGDIERGPDLDFIELVKEKKQHDHATLILVSYGGDPNAAYKIGRYMQDTYEPLDILVSGLCKSAGTLIAIAGDELVFTPYGELGPLDIQVFKEDQPGVHESGLNISEAFQTMEDRAKDSFFDLVFDILSVSDGVVSIKTAMSASSEMVSSMYSPIFGHFDPEEVGSRARAMRIGEEYARRLNTKRKNMRKKSITNLSRSYPSHGFVIDYFEAQRLFENVRLVNENEIKIIKQLGETARFPRNKPKFRFLTEEEINCNE